MNRIVKCEEWQRELAIYCRAVANVQNFSKEQRAERVAAAKSALKSATGVSI